MCITNVCVCVCVCVVDNNNNTVEEELVLAILHSIGI